MQDINLIHIPTIISKHALRHQTQPSPPPFFCEEQKEKPERNRSLQKIGNFKGKYQDGIINLAKYIQRKARNNRKTFLRKRNSVEKIVINQEEDSFNQRLIFIGNNKLEKHKKQLKMQSQQSKKVFSSAITIRKHKNINWSKPQLISKIINLFESSCHKQKSKKEEQILPVLLKQHKKLKVVSSAIIKSPSSSHKRPLPIHRKSITELSKTQKLKNKDSSRQREFKLEGWKIAPLEQTQEFYSKQKSP